MEEFVKEQCYYQIVRICSLLVYFDFQLSPEVDISFQNNKLLFSLGRNDDILTAYSNLRHIADSLVLDIAYFYGEVDDPCPWRIL